MCGIIGYAGNRDIKKFLVESLKRLEYRGYDSVGIGIISDKLNVFKEVGDVSNFERKLPKLKGNIGIGHTRWATHGEVSKLNAHPQISCNNKIAVVHNGIVENFKELKDKLKSHKFESQTDTEVIAHLIEENYKGNLLEAVCLAIKKIKGSYSIVVISEDEPDKIVGARNESPLIIGLGDGENFLASDIPAFLKYTKRVVYLNDGEICLLKNDSIKIYDLNGNEKLKKETLINWDIKDAEKSGFPHYMLKEIHDQQDTIQRALIGRIFEIEREIKFEEIIESLLTNRYNNIHIIACGTSYYSGFVGKYLIENLTGIPVYVDLASEYRFYGIRDNSSLVIAISQSGETSDTLAALKEAKKSGCNTLVITNVIGSSATRIADGFILTQSGPEIGVAATKTFTSQIIVLFLLALKISFNLKNIGTQQLYEFILQLKELPRKVRAALDQSATIREISKDFFKERSFLFIGRGINYPLALEGALKLKEISYIQAEGFAAGELKHGPFALLTKNFPVVVIVTKDISYDKILANIGEAKARGAKIIAIADQNDADIEKYADIVIRYPSVSNMLACIPISIILQLLAYHIADLRNCSIDKPRNLAKSVTVE